MTVSKSKGCVYVVSTPIGNLEDFSPRAMRSLRDADCIACEDTRRTARLCSAFGINTPRISLHAHNEEQRIPELLGRLANGATIALVSDAGTPLLSDPGARLVEAAMEAGVRVIPVPGPSAILAALVTSGMPTRPFTFLGFLPRKGKAREEWLERMRTMPGSLILFEAPGRVHGTLEDLHRVLGERRVALARELTKRFEEVLRGRLGEFDPPEPRGEVTLIVEGVDLHAPPTRPEIGDLRQEVERLFASGLSARDAARELAERRGLSRSEAYRHVLAVEGDSD